MLIPISDVSNDLTKTDAEAELEVKDACKTCAFSASPCAGYSFTPTQCNDLSKTHLGRLFFLHVGRFIGAGRCDAARTFLGPHGGAG